VKVCRYASLLKKAAPQRKISKGSENLLDLILIHCFLFDSPEIILKSHSQGDAEK
jgi:hypothetical protein